MLMVHPKLFGGEMINLILTCADFSDGLFFQPTNADPPGCVNTWPGQRNGSCGRFGLKTLEITGACSSPQNIKVMFSEIRYAAKLQTHMYKYINGSKKEMSTTL